MILTIYQQYSILLSFSAGVRGVMSHYIPVRYKPRLAVAVSLAYIAVGLLLILVLIAALGEWVSHRLLIVVASSMLMVEGVVLIYASAPKAELVLQEAPTEGCLVTEADETRVRQMSRTHNMLTFGAITSYAVISFLLSYQLEAATAILSNEGMWVLFLMLVYGVPVVIIPAIISLYTDRKYGDIKPILEAAERGFTKQLYHGAIERFKLSQARQKRKRSSQ